MDLFICGKWLLVLGAWQNSINTPSIQSFKWMFYIENYENILLAMLSDSLLELRRIIAAWSKIWTSVKSFDVSLLKFEDS